MKETTHLVEVQSKTYAWYVGIAFVIVLLAYSFINSSLVYAQTDNTETTTAPVVEEGPVITTEQSDSDESADSLTEEELPTNEEAPEEGAPSVETQAFRASADCGEDCNNEEPKRGSISGCKYFDETDNGEIDENAHTLPGWEFQLFQSPNAPWKTFPEDQALATAETGEDGCYIFENLEPGIYQVYEKVKPGWVQTHPAKTNDLGAGNPGKEGGNVLPLSLTKTIVPEGTDENSSLWNWINTKLFKNPTMMQILGFAMECLFNGDCSFDGQNQELRNIRYYTIHLGDDIQANEVMDVAGADFGNYNGTGSIIGRKFLDENKDGKEQEEEIGLSGWEIHLYQYPNAPWKDGAEGIPFATTTTDENGNYSFADIPSGIYQVFEVRQEGWSQTFPKKQISFLPTTLTPVEITNTLLVNDVTQQTLLGCTASLNECPDNLHEELLGVRYYGVFLKPNTTVDKVNFGNYEKRGEIRGMKFIDVNQNGTRNEGEPGIANWNIFLYKSPNAPWEEGSLADPLMATTTAEDGTFVFTNVPAGVYQVYEETSPLWTQTAPIGIQPITLPGGLLGLDLVRAKLTENPTAQKLLGCVGSIMPCSDELEDELSHKMYFSVLVAPGETVTGAEFGNHPSPLFIDQEETQQIETDSITVEWDTDRFATSRVVYGTFPVADGELSLPPNYGYEASTPLYDVDPKVQHHSVTITGLAPNTTYYWRAVSSASPEVVGDENVVTTPPASGVQNAPANSSTGGSDSSSGGGGSVTLPPIISLANTNTSAPVITPTQAFVTSNFVAQAPAQDKQTSPSPTTLAADDGSLTPEEQARADALKQDGVAVNDAPPITENENVAAASFSGLSGIPLWGSLAFVAILLVIVFRLVVRAKKP